MKHVTCNKYQNKQSGQILLISLIFLVIIMGLVISLVGYSAQQIKAHRQGLAREQALDIAEAGAELAIWKLNNQAGYAGSGGETNVTYANGTYNVALTNLSSSTKLVKVDAYVPNSVSPVAHRIVQYTATIGTENIGFNFGVQSGAGGFQIDNNAQVTGNVYTNNAIVGMNGAKITGDATSVSSITNVSITGNANSDTIADSSVTGNSNQHTSITNSIIGGSAWSDTFGNASNKCKITGPAQYKTSHTGCTAASWTQNNSLPNIPPPISLPIPDSQITDWEIEAFGGGEQGTTTISGTTCPTACLGPKKINGNLIVNGTLTITGTIWVTGSITINNGATVKLDASYGSLTGVLMAGTGDSTSGYINASNNSTLMGSGTTGSWLLLLSQMDNTTSNAIDIANNAISTIIYAGTGIVNVLNNAQVREVTGYKIHLNQNVILTPSSGTTDATYFSGTSGGWEILGQTWQLLL